MSKRANKSKILTVTLLTLGAIVLGGGAVAFIRNIISTAPAPQKPVVQTVQIIRPPPPPPDTPPPPPPPPEEKIEVPQDQPQQPDPTPSNEPPPGEQLGLDAEGGAGGDAFGLAGRKGGRDLLGSGGSALAWYGGLMKSEILAALGDDKMFRGAFSGQVQVWLRSDGTIERVKLLQSTGDRTRDHALESKLSEIGRFSQPPPADTPEPITLRIGSGSKA